MSDEALYPGQVRLRVHSPKSRFGPDIEEVSGRVLADKIGALYRALRAADKAANGRVRHEYTAFKLSSSAPTVVLMERPIRARQAKVFEPVSAIPAFDECVSAVTNGQPVQPMQFDCVRQLSRLARGSSKQFGYAELWTGDERVYRVDTREGPQAILPGTFKLGGVEHCV